MPQVPAMSVPAASGDADAQAPHLSLGCQVVWDSAMPVPAAPWVPEPGPVPLLTCRRHRPHRSLRALRGWRLQKLRGARDEGDAARCASSRECRPPAHTEPRGGNGEARPLPRSRFPVPGRFCHCRLGGMMGPKQHGPL